MPYLCHPNQNLIFSELWISVEDVLKFYRTLFQLYPHFEKSTFLIVLQNRQAGLPVQRHFRFPSQGYYMRVSNPVYTALLLALSSVSTSAQLYPLLSAFSAFVYNPDSYYNRYRFESCYGLTWVNS